MTTPAVHPIPTWALVAGGLLSLAVAMGIGRFAFTPVLPFMVRAGELTLADAGWVAAANYAGYLVGALSAARVPVGARGLAVLGLVGTAVATGAMAWGGLPAWVVLRFVSGVASAWVFVATSVWCLGALAARGAGKAGPIVYAGVGSGIALTGLYCLVASSFAPSTQWLHLGLLALVLVVPVLLVLARLPAAHAPAPTATVAAVRSERPLQGDTLGLVVCYGVMGFGYILPATFLPVLARGVVDDPRWFGLAWPIFGVTAAVSTLIAGWVGRYATRLQVWCASQALMGVGVLLPAIVLNGWTVAASALLVGGTFMVITLAGVQEMRERAGGNPARLVGRLTAAFAFGQIAGPVASALLLAGRASAGRGLEVALLLAAACLLASAGWMDRRFQLRAQPGHP